jgi:hypothetical protein
MRQIEGLISEGVLQGVRTMLPVKSILREYLATEETESEYESDSDSDSDSDNDEEEDAPSIVVPTPVVEKSIRPTTPVNLELDKPVVGPTVVEPHTLNLATKAVDFVESTSEKKVEEKKEPEELLFTDVNTDDIGFDDSEDLKTGLTGLKETVLEDSTFDFEEIA